VKDGEKKSSKCHPSLQDTSATVTRKKSETVKDRELVAGIGAMF
jgi:hypothetical protein